MLTAVAAVLAVIVCVAAWSCVLAVAMGRRRRQKPGRHRYPPEGGNARINGGASGESNQPATTT